MDEIEQQSVLPDHIIVDEILIRLPVKSLCRFKSVCKLWNSIISSLQFAKTHLHNQRHYSNVISGSNPKWVFFQYQQKSWLLNYEAYDSTDADCGSEISNSVRKFDFGLGDGLISRGKEIGFCVNGVEADPFGSSCGLVCLLVQNNKICVFNPILNQRRVLPNPDLFDTCDIILRGFGYASSLNDFKVVLGLRPRLEGKRDMSNIHVFSMTRNEWRQVERSEQFDDMMAKSQVYYKGVLVNDKLHWWITPTSSNNNNNNNNGHIFAFDLVHECFEDIPIPKALISKDPNMVGYLECSGISVIGGCLCLSVVYEKSKVEIWMLKHYVDVNSWVRMCNFHVPESYEYNCAEFFGLTKLGKLLIRCWSTMKDGRFISDMLFLIDPTQSCLKFNPIWFGGPISSIETYVESLVSLSDPVSQYYNSSKLPQ